MTEISPNRERHIFTDLRYLSNIKHEKDEKKNGYAQAHYSQPAESQCKKETLRAARKNDKFHKSE